MTTLLTYALVGHIILGLFGLAALHFAYMQLIRKKAPYFRIEVSAWLASCFFFASWATGAYYYVTYYGGAVKPRILASGYPWAHQVFMEAKEHVFVLIPFLTLLFALLIRTLRTNEDISLRCAAAWLAALTLALGVFVTASGIIISGAVR